MFNYESHRTSDENYIYHQNDVNLNFSPHLHNSYEFVYCKNGKLTVTLDDMEYQLNSCKSLLIFPMRAHAYPTDKFSESYLCVFSKNYISDFYDKPNDKEALNPVFVISNANQLIFELPQKKDL